MKRLVDIANKQIAAYLLSIIDTEKGKHLNKEDVLAYKFYKMGTSIALADVPNDLNLTGFDVHVMNVLHPLGCHIKIEYDKVQHNKLWIDIPEWLKTTFLHSRWRTIVECEAALTQLYKEEEKTFAAAPKTYPRD